MYLCSSVGENGEKKYLAYFIMPKCFAYQFLASSIKHKYYILAKAIIFFKLHLYLKFHDF